MKNFLVAVLLLVSFKLQATPQKIEMIFLAPQKVSALLEIIEKNKTRAYTTFAQNDQTYMDNCVPMGDGCFHPQYGYLNRKPVVNSQSAPVEASSPVAEAPTTSAVAKDPELQLKTFNAVETSMVNCDKGNYFDIFCGKERARGKFAEVEIWFDVSSSLRAADYNKDPNYCNRRTFLTKVMDGCKDRVSASIYNTSLKQIGDLSSVCLSYGGNDEAKILQWIKDSQAKTLLIVTDVDEMSKAMRDFLDSHGAKYIGEMKPFTSTDLVDYAKDFVKSCKK
ncbi:MAG: hypothetical protein ACXVLQ_06350 [Bacteriovorax sp.]